MLTGIRIYCDNLSYNIVMLWEYFRSSLKSGGIVDDNESGILILPESVFITALRHFLSAKNSLRKPLLCRFMIERGDDLLLSGNFNENYLYKLANS